MDAKQVALGSLLLVASGATLEASGLPGGRISLALAVGAIVGFVVLAVRARTTSDGRYA